MEKQIEDLQDQGRHLVEINDKHTLQMLEYANIIRDLASYLNILTLQNPAITFSDLRVIEQNIF